MKEKIKSLKNEIELELNSVKNLKDLNEIKNKYLSKKGPVSELSNGLRDLSIDNKKVYGKLITDFKNDINNQFNILKDKFETEELNKKLENEKIDISI